MAYVFGSIIDRFDLKGATVSKVDLVGKNTYPGGVFFAARRWSDAGEMLENLLVEASGEPKTEVYGRNCAPTCAYKITNNRGADLYAYFEGPDVYFTSVINGI